MKITTKNAFNSGSTTYSVKDYIDGSMQSLLAEGQIESVESKVNNISTAFGVLIEILADRGLLNADEIVKIAGKWEPSAELC